MILEDIVKQLANRINQPHVIKSYLLKVANKSYEVGYDRAMTKYGICENDRELRSKKEFIDQISKT